MLKIGAARQHGFALRKTAAEAVDDILPARLIGVEKRAFELSPDALRAAADGRRSDKPSIRAPARKQLPYVVARHQHIAVGQHDPIMARRAPALDHIVELRITAHPVVADQKPRVRARMLGDQGLDQRHDGIVCGSDAEQDFTVRIIEIECRTQRIAA
jgi:hypothetical protein